MRWLTLSQFAREWNKDTETVRRWCLTGFILTLGYHAYQEPKGKWHVGIPVNSTVTSSPLPPRLPLTT